MRTLRILVAVGVVSAAVLVTALPAAAGGGKEVIRTGNCSGSADWKLKVKLDDGRIDTEFEVDQNVNGQRWRVVLRRDGVRFFRGIRTTHAPSGSFTVDRRPPTPRALTGSPPAPSTCSRARSAGPRRRSTASPASAAGAAAAGALPARELLSALVGTIPLALLVMALPLRRVVRLRPGEALRYA